MGPMSGAAVTGASARRPLPTCSRSLGWSDLDPAMCVRAPSTQTRMKTALMSGSWTLPGLTTRRWPTWHPARCSFMSDHAQQRYCW
jgi:hypothetical protein